MAKRIRAIKARLAKAKNPERKAAIKAQLKAAKKVVAIRKALRKATSPVKRAALKSKLVAARAALKRATVKFHRVTLRVEAKK